MAIRFTYCCVLGLLVFGCSSSDGDSATRRTGIADTGGGASATGGVVSTGGMLVFEEPPPPKESTSNSADASTNDVDCTMTRCKEPVLDDDNCGFQTVEGEIKTIETPGTLLFVYDRSGSMDQDWNGEPKYQAAGNAIMAAIEPIQDLLTVGSVFFPSLDVGASGCVCNVANPLHWIPGPDACCLNGVQTSCEVTDITQPDQIDFRSGAAFIAELPNQWRLQGAGSTPLQTGVEQAAQAVASNMFDGSLTIVIVTDGEPNCGTDNQTVIDQVSAWSVAGYKTYVVGLPGAQGAASLLDELAVAGGTGSYLDPGDPATLQAKLTDIVLSTVGTGIASCDIALTPPAEAPDKLRLVVKIGGVEQAMERDDTSADSWTVTADGSSVTLNGLLCDNALAGTYDNLRFDFGCLDLPPADPPVVPVLK